ncbi:hypothetical protein B0T17DRAFT_508451 [Bombardia bombarda]|uniref:Uncharacterized protein n=1 Tax=Bombardia bombarda TaxID=252184 RepID=A0AA40C5X0_9PEZI|nr:hypothetical protein B0T17DRAFT_508451 [Bombardia bombarda]
MNLSFPLFLAAIVGISAHSVPGMEKAALNQGQLQPRKEHRAEISAVSESTAQFSCDTLVYGLNADDCAYMAAIGMAGQGENSLTDNGLMWIGSDGPNTFTFVNAAGMPITLIMWRTSAMDNQAAFMNARPPLISYSLPTTGSAIEISIDNSISGGWSSLYNHETTLTQYGQVSNTFGEFSTGTFATVDVSSLVNMSGNPMTIVVDSGCVSDMNTCVYKCNAETENMCGASRSYSLLNCAGHNAVVSNDQFGNPTGGCQGWTYGGHIDVIMT